MATSMDSSTSNRSGSSELFTDLDPLGTGKSRPYYDRNRDIFNEFKTPNSTPRSDSGPSSITSQPSGPAPAFSSMSSSGNGNAPISNSSDFGGSVANCQTKPIPNIASAPSGISAPPQVSIFYCYLKRISSNKKLFGFEILKLSIKYE